MPLTLSRRVPPATVAAVAGALLLGGASLSCRIVREPAFPTDTRLGPEWAALPPLPTNLPPQAKLLTGLRVVLDPGHGGDIGPRFDASGYKRGPTGLREAIINMRVAEELKNLLERSGAVVLMTREADVEVTLPERARMANEFAPDLFLSIHHNSGNPTANYASVWYNADGERNPAALDVSRELVDSLVRWMRHPQPLSGGVYSDSLMYGDGFAVLRDVRATAVLAECSFFSNPIEEDRLRDPEYNRRTAWALYLGLCDWAASGVPRWKIERVGAGGKDSTIQVRLLDGMKEGWGSENARVRTGTIRVLIDGRPTDRWRYADGVVTIEAPRLWETNSERQLEIRFENRAKNASITPTLVLKPGEAIAVMP